MYTTQLTRVKRGNTGNTASNGTHKKNTHTHTGKKEHDRYKEPSASVCSRNKSGAPEACEKQKSRCGLELTLSPYTLHVTRYTSHVTRYTSHVTRSHETRLIPSACRRNQPPTHHLHAAPRASRSRRRLAAPALARAAATAAAEEGPDRSRAIAAANTAL